PARWAKLHASRPETYYLWYRTSSRTLVPFGNENPVTGLNPPLTTSGMTLVVVDPLGRLVELAAVPDPAQREAAPFTDWKLLFALAGVPMDGFAESPPTWVPPVHAEQRAAWEGRTPEIADHTIRIEAGATRGKPVFFAITGPWTRSARSPAAPTAAFFARAIGFGAGLVMPALILVRPLPARRHAKLRTRHPPRAFPP